MPPTLEDVRALIAREVARSSARVVAEEVGVDNKTLGDFAAGRTEAPRGSVRRKLFAYAEARLRPAEPAPPQTSASAHAGSDTGGEPPLRVVAAQKTADYWLGALYAHRRHMQSVQEQADLTSRHVQQANEFLDYVLQHLTDAMGELPPYEFPRFGFDPGTGAVASPPAVAAGAGR
jgi:hypothetical protein